MTVEVVIDSNVLEKKFGHMIGRNALNYMNNVLSEAQSTCGSTTHVQIDLTGLAVKEDLNVELGRLMYKYGIDIRGLDDRVEELSYLKSTGYYIKEELGKVAYSLRLKELIERSDYPLMISDMRGHSTYKKYDINLKIIQPVTFDHHSMIYRELISIYSDPRDLTTALRHGKKIWEMKMIQTTSLGELDVGIRFAHTIEERNILDVITATIEGTLEWEL